MEAKIPTLFSCLRFICSSHTVQDTYSNIYVIIVDDLIVACAVMGVTGLGNGRGPRLCYDQGGGGGVPDHTLMAMMMVDVCDCDIDVMMSYLLINDVC